jgi:glycosyltransferase involved in cell wall biosynthesis
VNAAPSNWVLHDFLQVNGGAEHLVIALARGLHGFGLGVSGIYEEFSSTGEMGDLHYEVTGGLALCLPRVARAVYAFSSGPSFVAGAKCVIYSGLYAPLAAAKQRGGKKIYYCHTPPRFAFDRIDEYLNRVPKLMRRSYQAIVSLYRQKYLEALHSMDAVVVNSEHVRARLLKLTGIDSQVIYPPIDTELFKHQGDAGYFLSTARLEPAKRVDRIVQAFLAMPEHKLVVASGGSQSAALKTLASGAPNIKFTGWVTDTDMYELVGNSRAVIYVPGDEDFGMSAVEAMAAGKPVIGVAEGGLTESVQDGQTGLLLAADPAPSEIAVAVKAISPQVAQRMKRFCEMRAADFSTHRFLTSFRALVD